MPGGLSATLEAALAQLFAVRYGESPDTTTTFPPARNNHEAKTYPWPGRIPAVTDTKMIVAWNSLMISGLARAAAVLQQPAYLHLAAQAAQFILTHQFVGDRLHRLNYDGLPSVIAQSEDYALLIKALLDLDQAAQAVSNHGLLGSSPSPWLAHAVSLQDEFHTHLWSLELGGYYNTDASSDLVVRERSIDDNATPAANGVAIANLVRLALRTENLDYLDQAEQALQSFSGAMKHTPQACPSLFAALDWFQTHTLVRTTGDRLLKLEQQYFPTAVYALADSLPDATAGLVCQGLSCQEPARDDQQLLTQLQLSQTRG